MTEAYSFIEVDIVKNEMDHEMENIFSQALILYPHANCSFISWDMRHLCFVSEYSYNK